MIGLGSGNFCSSKPSAAFDLDSAGSASHGSAHCVLHRASEADPLLELGCDVLCNQLSVRVGVSDFDYRKSNALADKLFNFKSEGLYRLTALADDDTGSGAVDEYADLRAVTFDLYFRNAGRIKLLLEEPADLVIFNYQIADFVFSCVPSGIPVFDNADSQSVGINFLTHNSASFPYSFSATQIVMWLVRLFMRYILP